MYVMMFGLAAIMIFFIAAIVAGTILGTALALASLVQYLRGTRHTSAGAAAVAPAERTVAEGAL